MKSVKNFFFYLLFVLSNVFVVYGYDKVLGKFNLLLGVTNVKELEDLNLLSTFSSDMPVLVTIIFKLRASLQALQVGKHDQAQKLQISAQEDMQKLKDVFRDEILLQLLLNAFSVVSNQLSGRKSLAIVTTGKQGRKLERVRARVPIAPTPAPIKQPDALAIEDDFFDLPSVPGGAVKSAPVKKDQSDEDFYKDLGTRLARLKDEPDVPVRLPVFESKEDRDERELEKRLSLLRKEGSGLPAVARRRKVVEAPVAPSPVLLPVTALPPTHVDQSLWQRYKEKIVSAARAFAATIAKYIKEKKDAFSRAGTQQ